MTATDQALVIALGVLSLLIIQSILLGQKLNQRFQDMATSIAEQLTALEASVAANTSVEEGAIALLNKIPQLILDAASGADAETLARIQAAADAVTAESAKLAAAVTANTPAAPPAPQG